MPIHQEHCLELAGDTGPLEARLVEANGPPPFAAVVAHPHPLYGGSMDNPVTRLLAMRLAAAGATVLRFNFRGVGSSAGVHDQGRGELEDLAVAKRYLMLRAPAVPIWLAGYSFGASMALRLAARQATETTCDRIMVVAPPLSNHDLGFAARLEVPIAAIFGGNDPLTPSATVDEAQQRWSSLVDCQRIAGAGHDLGVGATDFRVGATSGAATLAAAIDRAISALA